MNTSVIFVNEDETTKQGSIFIRKRENGMIMLVMEDLKHMDEAVAHLYPEDALRLGMKLIAFAYNEDRDS